MELPNAVDGRLVTLYERAVICTTFPAYKIEDLDEAPVGDLLQAIELLNTARKALTK